MKNILKNVNDWKPEYFINISYLSLCLILHPQSIVGPTFIFSLYGAVKQE